VCVCGGGGGIIKEAKVHKGLQSQRKKNGAYQLVAYTDHVNIVGRNTHTIQKNTEALLDASKKVGLEVNPEKT
jgi:hypothetical protein